MNELGDSTDNNLDDEKFRKEYEALSVVRDILVILYKEITENTGEEPLGLFELYDHANALVEYFDKKFDCPDA